MTTSTPRLQWFKQFHVHYILRFLMYQYTIKGDRLHYSENLKFAVMNYDNASLAGLLRGHMVSSVCDSNGTTLLHLSCIYGNDGLTEELISVGCPVDAQDLSGLTPLAFAVLYGRREAVKILLEAGASMHLRDYRGLNPLESVAMGDISRPVAQFEIGALNDLRIMCTSTTSLIPLFFNAMRRRGASSRQIARHLLDAGWPLYLGVLAKDVEVTKGMLESGRCLIDACDPQGGLTALHKAVSMDDYQQVALLIKHGANVNARDIQGQTPIYNAWLVQHCAEIMSLLMAAGTRLETCNEYGRMQSYYILKYGDATSARILLEYQIDMLVTDGFGESILHYIALNRDEEVFDLFRQLYHLEVDVANTMGLTPLHVAANNANYGYVKLLLERNADPNAQDLLGCTPLDLVAKKRFHTLDRKRTTVLLLKSGSTISKESLEEAMNDENNEAVVEPILEHIIKIEMQVGTPPKIIRDLDDYLTLINDHVSAEDHYEECTRELSSMKRLRLYGSITFYDILMNDTDLVAKYMRNSRVIRAFEYLDRSGTFPLYAAVLDEQFSKAIEKHRLTENASMILRDSIKVLAPHHIVIDKILGYLSDDELRMMM